MEMRPLGNTGLMVSALGFGGSPLGGSFGPIDEAEGIRSVHAAIDQGINFFDVSPFYGNTRAETVLGKALRGIPRDRFLLSTKAGRYDQGEFDFSAARMRRSVEESLQRLQLDTIDVLHCHDIEFVALDQVVQETIPALRELRNEGKIRFIGISGLPLQIYETILSQTEVDVILSYCHYTLNDDSLLKIMDFLQTHRVGIVNAAPFSMGLLTNQNPPAWHPASPELRAACAQAAARCQERGADIAQLALKFATSEPRIATTLVGMRTTEEVQKNVAALNAPLDTQLLAEIQTILAPIHNQTWPSGLPENSS